MSDPLERGAERAKRFLREDPFAAKGGNPYGEPIRAVVAKPDVKERADAAGAAGPSNAYASPNPSADEVPYQIQFETTEASRGGFLLGLALVGLALSGIPTAIGSWRYGFATDNVYFVVSSLAASLPAITLSFRDLSAMSTGSMERSTQAFTTAAFWLGIVGTLVVATYAVLMFRLWQLVPWRAIMP